MDARPIWTSSQESKESRLALVYPLPIAAHSKHTWISSDSCDSGMSPRYCGGIISGSDKVNERLIRLLLNILNESRLLLEGDPGGGG